ncbi:PREDICTED: transmembrane protein 91-like isoform X2 [Branchiostoma belcheri]|uniref:Transmembrane protein 91-like isoform X2 n=1 Tax=Branchiostoma belcheri TaxID=7741 RepID=A0A6P5A3U7_BRABE|nr:PREDICTED: transmembrane protein 91-like isoform X2 [Branchiostoma belcheri]
MSVAPGYPQPVMAQQSTVVVGGAPQTMVIVQESKPDSHVGMAIFTCLCCFWPLGLVSLIFACMVDSRWESGDREGAKSASRTASILWKIALGIGLAAIIIVVIIVPVYFLVILTGCSPLNRVDSSRIWTTGDQQRPG